MKKTLIISIMAVSLFTSCYDDKGGNDYDRAMDEVEISIPEDAYSGSIGSDIKISPVIKTNIADEDLTYHWEVIGANTNSNNRAVFSNLVADDKQSKDLDYTCKLDTNVTSLNTAYKCRLRVHQKSTGRDFYSSPSFTITIAGITGLMILHDNDVTSDIGVLDATEFTPSANSLPSATNVISDMYSKNNNGNRLSGKGKEIVQGIMGYVYGAAAKNRQRIYVLTDKGAQVENNTDLSKYAEWKDMFYLKGDKAVNSNNPRGIHVISQYVVAFDGDDMFMLDQSNYDQFLFAEMTPTTKCGDGNSMTLEPYIVDVASRGHEYLGYSDALNGDKTRKGFVSFDQLMPSNTVRYASFMDIKNDNTAFNPGDMKADPIVMRKDSRAHVMAVMKGDATNKQFAGKYFAVDLWPNAPIDDSKNYETGFANYPKYLYNLTLLTDIDNAVAFEFGGSQNMCYYATPSAVYRYGVDGSTLYPSSPIKMTDGTAVSISGEVTMMKILDSPNVKTRNTEPILLVATYDGSNATLYAMHLDTMTGNVISISKFDSSSVSGWKFGKIRDANIKAM